jgi:hypothetical protein
MQVEPVRPSRSRGRHGRGIIMCMDPGNRGGGLQKDARDHPDEHRQGSGGQAFKKAHPFAFWMAFGPIAIMFGIIVVAALAVIVVLISLG